MSFKNKTVYITGGSSGIGLSTAKLLYSMGADVAIFARNKEKLQQAIAKISNGEASRKPRMFPMDVAYPKEVAEVMKRSITEFGIPDILINCAGRALPDHFENITAEQFSETININLKGTWNVISQLVPHMKAKGGHIVNTASIAGFVGVFGYTDYCASKFAIIGLSEALKSELRKYNITVSVLCPPDTDTPGFETENLKKPDETKAISTNAKLMTPDKVAHALIKGIQKKQFMIIPGTESKLTFLLKRYAPTLLEFIMEREIKKTQTK